MDCKKALEEAVGDVDKAVELLRIKGAKDVGKRAARTASNGLVTIVAAGDATVMLELNCETDFVAKTDKFQALAAQLAQVIADARPDTVEALLALPVADGTVASLLQASSATIGEKLELRRFALVTAPAATTAVYLHKSSPDLPPTLGVVVQFAGPVDAELGRDVTQQVAAMAPLYVSRDDVPADVVAKEKEIAEQTAIEEGKPAAALSKIVMGRLNGYFKDFTLLEQPFVKDNKKAIKKLLDENGATVVRFARFKVGA
jgi:elongation factor Ts